MVAKKILVVFVTERKGRPGKHQGLSKHINILLAEIFTEVQGRIDLKSNNKNFQKKKTF